MDSTFILAVANPYLKLLIPMGVLVFVIKSPRLKGYGGELLVRGLVRLRLPRDSYHPLHNITLLTPDSTTQIDHVIVSRFGVFVLETKNMKGWIFGNENQAQWTQKIYRHTFRFQNPLRQNYKHLKTLEAALGVCAESLHCVVVFVGDCSFKTPMPANVTVGRGAIDYIKSFNEPVFTDAEVLAIIQRIKARKLPSTLSTHRKHVRNMNSRPAVDTERCCPACGRALVLRTVKRGDRAGKKFRGCSGFPRCRTTLPLAENHRSPDVGHRFRSLN